MGDLPSSQITEVGLRAKLIRQSDLGADADREYVLDKAATDPQYSPAHLIRKGVILYSLGSGSDYRVSPYTLAKLATATPIKGVLARDVWLKDTLGVAMHNSTPVSQIAVYRIHDLWVYSADVAAMVRLDDMEAVDYTAIIYALRGLYNHTSSHVGTAVYSPVVDPEVLILVRQG